MEDEEAILDSDTEIEVIDLHLCHGKIMVWNAQDVKVLREVHHIVGSLVGALPRAPRQNSLMGLPLQLMPEEANVLLEYGAARLINIKTHKPNAEQVTQFEADRKESFQKQKELWTVKKAKKREELSHIIGLGRMSRKQRRAEKERKRKLQQEEAKLKMQKLEAPEEQTHDQLREQTNPEVSLNQPPDQTNKQSHDQTDKQTNQEVSTQSHDQSTDNRTIEKSHEESHDKELKEEREETRHRTANNTKCRAPELSTLLTQDGEVQGNNEVAESSSKLGENVERTENNGATCVSIKTNETGKDDRTLPMSVEETKTHLISNVINKNDGHKHLNMSKPEDCPGIEFQRNKDGVRSTNAGDTQKACGSGTISKKDKTGGQDTGDQDKTDKHQSEDQGCLIQLFTGTPNINPRSIHIPDWDFPETPDEIMRCRVFKNFWEQGYYITSGSKFGGDFLAYPGDPFLYHSFYIIICMPFKKTISPLDIVAWGRMASNVKKSVVLCSVDETDEVVYTSVQWTGIT